MTPFAYTLPESLIAKHPPKIRGKSRLLVLDRKAKTLTDKHYKDLPDLLSAGDLIILNDTKVIKSRLTATNTRTNKPHELIILERHKSTDYHHHRCLHRGKLRPNDVLKIDNHELIVQELDGAGVATINSTTNLLDIAETHGEVPLPPYLARKADKTDEKRYQTVFAEKSGSAAAPTASLNMTKSTLARLAKKGIIIKHLTLHVGLGTFLPIRTEKIEDHKMHSEYFEIPPDTIQAIHKARKNNNKVIALGTTVCRTLEHAAPQILASAASGDPSALSGEADIFIHPGHNFQLTNALLTNFHAPDSTVLMLAAAFAGVANLEKSYTHAIANDYKFLSYGDSMFIH